MLTWNRPDLGRVREPAVTGVAVPPPDRRALAGVKSGEDHKEGIVAAKAETYNGYCVKCKEKRDFDGEVNEKNGRRMAQGTCPVCGTKMNRILGKA